MSQAIVNSGELRRFAQQLKHFNSELVSNLSALQRQAINLVRAGGIRSIRNSPRNSSRA